MSKIFAVIYRFYLLKEMETKYLSYWRTLTHYFIHNKGALNSTLHKTEDGYFLAYSKWPDQKTRDACWSSEDKSLDLPLEIERLIQKMKACIDLNYEPFPEICMDLIEEAK